MAVVHRREPEGAKPGDVLAPVLEHEAGPPSFCSRESCCRAGPQDGSSGATTPWPVDGPPCPGAKGLQLEAREMLRPARCTFCRLLTANERGVRVSRRGPSTCEGATKGGIVIEHSLTHSRFHSCIQVLHIQNLTFLTLRPAGLSLGCCAWRVRGRWVDGHGFQGLRGGRPMAR